jgi:hypothetical protein
MQIVFNHLQSSIQNACLVMIPLFMLIKMGLIILRGFISGHPFNFHSFYSGILLWIFIATYSVVIQQVANLSNFIITMVTDPVQDPITAISTSMNEARALRMAVYNKNLDQSAQKIKSGNLWQGLKDWTSSTWGAMIEGVKSTGMDLMASIIAIFASLARAFIETIRSILLKFLIIVGPLALTLSINEGFQYIGKFWFQKLISVYLWSLTLNILDHIIIDYYHQIAVLPVLNSLIGPSVKTPETPFYVDQLLVGFMYTLVPWLTSLFLGGFNSGHFLSTSFRAFTSLVTTGLSTSNSLINRK